MVLSRLLVAILLKNNQDETDTKKRNLRKCLRI